MLGKSCYVYKIKYEEMDKYTGKSEFVEAIICVDKETGLWLKMDKIGNNTLSMTVSNIEYNSDIISCLQIVEMDEQAIYNENGIVITAKELDCYDTNDAILLLEIKNNNANDITFVSQYFNINGLCIGGSIFEGKCLAGETKQTTLKIPNFELSKLCNIEIIKDIEFTHEVFCGDSIVNSTRVTEESELVKIEFN